MPMMRVNARRDLSSPVSKERLGRSLSRLTVPMTQQRSTSLTSTVVAALPSKWPRRKRSPSPPRRNKSDGNSTGDEGLEIVPPNPPRPPSLWRWRARARGHRHECQRQRLGLPLVDWRRQNLQVLFVDRTGVTRARFAALLTERVGDWCGLGRALAPSAAGLSPAGGEQGEHEGGSASFDLSGSGASAALMAQASRLSLRPKAFAAPRAPAFELADLDAFDLVVAVDAETRVGILALLGGEGSADALFYAPRVARLGDFAACRSPGRSLRRRGSDTLDEELAAMLSPSLGRFCGPLSALGGVLSFSSSSPPVAAGRGGRGGGGDGGEGGESGDVPRVPSLSGESSGEDFDRMIEETVRGVAGLVQYLADGLPLDGDGGER